jgi:hypothetical protein
MVTLDNGSGQWVEGLRADDEEVRERWRLLKERMNV